MEPGEGYIGLEQLIDSGRVRQCSPFIATSDDGRQWINMEAVDEISRVIRGIPFKTINFVRVPQGWDPATTVHQEEARLLFSNALREDVCIRSYTQRDQGVTLDNILETLGMRLSGEPNQHSFIFLVDKFRVSKTLTDPRFLGVMYDRSSPAEDVTIQGLAGRICGYKTNTHSVVFTDLVHVRRYLRWWNDGCRANPGRGRRAQTWAGTTGSSNNRLEFTDALVRFFESKAELRAWGRSHLGFNGGHQLSEDKSMFHECTLRGRAIQSCEWVETQRGWGFGFSRDSPRVFHCYQDVTDPSTLRYALCYRPHHVRT